MQIRREFRALLNLDEHVGTLKQLWPDWAEKILAMGRMESANRPALKKRLQELDNGEDLDCKDGESSINFTKLLNRP